MNEDQKAHWERIQRWLNKKPKTTRYMSEEEKARMNADIVKSVDGFKAWLKSKFPGDNVSNMRDCARKGRARGKITRGELNKKSKLTASQVGAIRDLVEAKVPQRLVGVRFHVSQAAVWYIAHRRNWGHIP